MWKGLIGWMEEAMLGSQPQLINPEDLRIAQVASTAGEAIEILRARHDAWLAAGQAG
jgi:hypothetical protein